MGTRKAVVALCAVIAAGGHGSALSQEAVPGAKAEIVRLDAVVTDTNGNPIRDLSREDFELRDDGKPQRLTHFAFVGKDGATEAKATAEPPEKGATAPAAAPEEEAAPQAGRQIAILVDDLHISPGSLESVKEALRRVADEFLRPNDNVALITTSSPGGVQALTQERATLKQAINALALNPRATAPGKDSQMTPEQAELILRGDRNALLLAAKMMVEDPSSVYNDPRGTPRGQVGTGSGANPRSVSPDKGEQQAAVEASSQARGILMEALRFSTVSLSRVDDILRGLASLPGRKLCLLVSEGFLVGAGTTEERTQELQRIIDAATRSGAVVYALDAHGLATDMRDASHERQTSSAGLQAIVAHQGGALMRTTLQTVANDTGGFLVRGTNDLTAGMRRMLADNEAYYLLAYEPVNQKRDGHFHRIELRLPHRPQLVVRTRKGYYAPQEGKVAGAPPRGLTESDSLAVLGQAIPTSTKLSIAADFLALPTLGPHAVVRAHVDVGGLTWRRGDGRLRAALYIVGGAYNADGNPVGTPFRARRELDLSQAEYERAKVEGIDFQQQVPLEAGRYQIRVVAQDPDGQTVGGATQWVEIPNLADRKLALSGIFLMSSPTSGGSLASKPATGGLTTRDVHALRRFKRTDGLYFQFYVYNPAVDDQGACDAVIQAQIWSQSKVVAASKPQPATQLVKDGASITQANGMSLDSLAPGLYALRIVVVDRKANATASRNIDFTVD
ncbi:MAG TPA: VWA domain-containing protein [Vicinamibacteria bacterium]|nr:VWA domain-containing protein [Vicinamibacteria bacterium]